MLPSFLLLYGVQYFVHPSPTTAASRRPTYGELIDLLEKPEKEAPLDYEALCSEFQQLYPHLNCSSQKIL